MPLDEGVKRQGRSFHYSLIPSMRLFSTSEETMNAEWNVVNSSNNINSEFRNTIQHTIPEWHNFAWKRCTFRAGRTRSKWEISIFVLGIYFLPWRSCQLFISKSCIKFERYGHLAAFIFFLAKHKNNNLADFIFKNTNLISFRPHNKISATVHCSIVAKILSNWKTSVLN